VVKLVRSHGKVTETKSLISVIQMFAWSQMPENLSLLNMEETASLVLAELNTPNPSRFQLDLTTKRRNPKTILVNQSKPLRFFLISKLYVSKTSIQSIKLVTSSMTVKFVILSLMLMQTNFSSEIRESNYYFMISRLRPKTLYLIIVVMLNGYQSLKLLLLKTEIISVFGIQLKIQIKSLCITSKVMYL
jgi:hypothetical protein